jgi:protein involved in sex pheromone biosynthesis
MKKIVIVLIASLLLTGCIQREGDQSEIVQETKEAQEKAIIPYAISNDYYRTILPFKESEARGLIVGTVSNRLDIDELETGLMRLSQDAFSTKKYFYQEGQYLTSDIVLNWLKRKEDDGAEPGLQGLNPEPSTQQEKNLDEKNRKTPRYLSHILEQNYLVKNSNGKVEIGGISIALSLNSVYYYKVPEYGWPRETELDQKKVTEYGKKYAQEVVSRIRQMEGLGDIPILIALFKEEPRNSVVPGNFFMKAEVGADDSSIKKWEDINEEYVLFPSENATENYFNDSTKVLNFKSDIDEYFTNYVGVVGKGFYINNQLQELSFTIPLQFFGKAEVIGFTEYITGKIMDHFPPYIKIKVYISSLDKPESLIVREPNSDKPYVHIYQ